MTYYSEKAIESIKKIFNETISSLNLIKIHIDKININDEREFIRRGVELCIEDLCSITPGRPEQLMDAICANDIEAVKQAIEKGADVNAKNEYDWEPLHEAARCGHSEIVKMLVEAGANVNAKTKFGTTPLMKACGQGSETQPVSNKYLETITLLLDYGADIYQKDQFNTTIIDNYDHDKTLGPILNKYVSQVPSSKNTEV